MTDLTISGPFGENAFPVPELQAPTTQPGGNGPAATGPAVPLTNDAVARDKGFAEATAARTARAYRPDATVLESIGAAISQWDTTRLIRRFGRPEFNNDTPINTHEYLQELPLVLSQDERDYFLDVARGAKSAQYAMDKITDSRMAAQAVGDHPVAGLATSFMDPLWLVVPPAIRIGKVAPVAGRVVSGIASAGIAGAVTANGEGPVSDSEIALSMLMNGAMGATLYRAGKVRPVDPEFPQAALDAKVADVAASVQRTEAVVKPRYRLVSAAEWEDVQVPPVPAVTREVPEQSPVATSKPKYGYQGLQFSTLFSNDLDKAAYILAGRGKSAAHDKIMAWATSSSGQTAEALIARGQELRAEFRKRAPVEPTETLTGSASPFQHKPTTRTEVVTPEIPGRTERRKTKEAVYEELPPALQPGSTAPLPARVDAVDKVLSAEQDKNGWGRKLQWNIHKTMSGFGTEGKRIADMLFDNNSDLSVTSMEAHRESILSELRTHQVDYENLLRRTMAENGAGIGSMVNPMTSRQAYATQAAIERELHREMFRREQMTRDGLPITNPSVPEHITKMADMLDALHKRALHEMQAAGVNGAENLLERPGYVNRKWSSLAIDNVLDRLEATGLTREAAHSRVTDLVALSLRRANGMDRKLANQVGTAIVDRALRKGYFEDSAFNAPSGVGVLAEMRDVLSSGGMSATDIERALNVLRVQNDDAGKAAVLKHRMDLDYKATIRIGGQSVSIMDLIDSRVSTIVDQYIQQVSTQSALARKGLGTRSAVQKAREELLHNTPVESRKEAAELFDNSMAHYMGNPAGAKVNEKFRLIQAYGRTISLAWSGLWQMTEYATMMAEYGLRKTLKYAGQEIPGFRAVLTPDKKTATALNNVLAEHSVASMRIRPYIAKFEDGYDMDMSNALQLAAQTTGQMVPYANAMRYVHHNQARIVGNLIMDRLRMASEGNPAARDALQRYGLEAHVMDKLAAEIKQHGMDVDSWSDSVWEATRPAFAKMMDHSVLRGRLGDVPAFAAFDPLGKFIFTYRTFVLTAHNKVLAGMLDRNGAGAVGLLLMYQLPLAMAAVQAQSVMTGKGTLSTEDLIKKSVGQMGGIGLFSEPFKWATGESNSVGAPGLIPVDRAVKLFSGGLQGDPRQAGSAALSMLPVISANPFWNSMVKQTTSKE